jgi:para-aminobenzoate synthetase component 2
MKAQLRIAVIDNRDSFVFNLIRYLEELGAQCTRFENDLSPDVLEGFDGVMVSPGPGSPKDAGTSMAIIEWAYQKKKPLLGVCLGHQAIAECFGGKVSNAKQLIHGAISKINHDEDGIFQGIPQDFQATRYHSLAITSMPSELQVTATSEDGEVMAIKHESAPIVGLQFHPESVLTEHGHALLKNWLDQIV